LKKYDEAIKCYDKVINTNDDRFRSIACLNRGALKYELGDYPSALQDFRKIDYAKYKGQKYIDIGLCHYRLGWYEGAEKAYRNAMQVNSKLVEAYYNLAVIYNSENKRDKANRNKTKLIKYLYYLSLGE
jgi:tetratricopeptide (TPR) repeat protein